MITGPEAGITREFIACDWEWETAARCGWSIPRACSKRAKVDDKLERLSVADTRRAIDYAEVVVLLLDATRGLEAQDLRIADASHRGRPRADHRAQQMGRRRKCLVAVQRRQGGARRRAGQVRGVPLLTVSAKTGKGIDTMLKVAFELREAWSRRVPTGELNRWFEAAVEANPPPAPRRQADQAALHHPGQDPPAELRRVRQPRRPTARQLSAIPGQRDAARARLRCCARPPRFSRTSKPVRQRSPLRQILPFRAYPRNVVF